MHEIERGRHKGSPPLEATSRHEPRIAPLASDELNDNARALAADLLGNYGLTLTEMPDSIATMLRHPDLYDAQVKYFIARTKAMTLPARDLEIVILRTGWLCRSGYIWSEHVKIGKKAGIIAQEIKWITQGHQAPGWNARDRALNQICEELHDTSHVSDETWAVAATHFTEKQIIELLSVIGSYHEIAFLYNTLRVQLIPGSLGLAAR
jgi:4-carboxymuconolactone decarboxylase